MNLNNLLFNKNGKKSLLIKLTLFRPSTGIPVLHSGSHFRHGLLQLMIHTIDPLHDGNFFFLLL